MIIYFVNVGISLFLLSIIFTILIATITAKILKKKSPKSLDEDKDPIATIIIGFFIFIISSVLSGGVHVLQLYLFTKNTDQILVENYNITRSDNTLDFTKLGADPNMDLYYEKDFKTPYDKSIISYIQPLNKNRQFTILNETDRNIRIKSMYDKGTLDINLKTHPELFKTLKNLRK